MGRQLPALKSAILRSSVRLQSDDRLVELLRAGVPDAFDVIVERYRPALLRYAGRMVGADRAEDVVQDVLVKAHSNLVSDDRPMQLKAWLYRITHNLALDNVRQKSWNYEQLDENYDGVRQPPDYLEQKERLWGIIERMGVLPERQRKALLLRAFEGRSSEEIARELEESVPEARQLVHRARVQLRNAFGGMLPIPLLLWLSRNASANGAQASVAATHGTTVKGLAAFTKAALVKGVALGVLAGGVAGSGGIALGLAGDGTAVNLSGERAAALTSSGDERSGANALSGRTVRARASKSRPRDGAPSDERSGTSAPSGSEGPDQGAGDSPTSTGDRGRDSGGSPRDERGGTGDEPVSSPSPDGGGSTGGDSTGGGSTGGGATGGGSTGGGSTDGGSTGGGGGGEGGGDQTCIGPVAQLPPICLPDLGGGGGGLLP